MKAIINNGNSEAMINRKKKKIFAQSLRKEFLGGFNLLKKKLSFKQIKQAFEKSFYNINFHK